MDRSRPRLRVCTATSVLVVAASAAAQSVTLLPPGAIPARISGDGRVIVGTLFDGDRVRAFRAEGGEIVLLEESDPVPGTVGTAISANGLHAAGADAATLGICGSVNPVEFYTASAWLEGGVAITPIGTLAGDNWSEAVAIADNAVVAGRSAFRSGDSRLCLYTFRSFRWSPDEGLVALTYPDASWQLLATGICADGGLITGYAQTLSGDRAFVFSTDAGVRPLDPPEGMPPSPSRAEDTSDDGGIIVGSAVRQASVWTHEGPAVPVARAAGVDHPNSSSADRVSGNGSAATGAMTFWLQGSPPQLVTRIFLWDRVRGARLIPETLESEFGLDLTGIAINEVADLSRTGRYLVIDGAVDGQRRGLLIDLGRPAACIADTTLDGVINSADFFAFLGSFFNGDADVDEDGATDSADFFEFLGAFFSGC